MTLCLFITAGRGPAECNHAVAGILARMQDEALGLGLTFDIDTTAAKHRPKSAVVTVHGAQAARFVKSWCGTIQWRAPSALRKGHKRANWFIGVFELSLDAAHCVRLVASDVTFETFRAGGSGGQHQNTTDSAVRAIHTPTGAVTVARDDRSQHWNKAIALSRLEALLAARATAQAEDRKAAQNQLHTKLERGNPIRRFKGPGFVEQKGGGHD